MTIRRCIPTSLLMVLALLASSCGEDVTYRDAQAVVPPLQGAGEFLGYSSIEAKRTVCGNCHSGKQAGWEQTRHASAWSDGAKTPGWSAACEGCHTVNARGNTSTEPTVGYLGAKNARYYDVQCESCHGPGLKHVSNPDAANKPLAPIAVDTALTYGCGECHSGAHTPFVEEWRSSNHSRVIESRNTNPSCNTCHDAKEVLKGWGVKSVFIEQEVPGKYMAVTCAVCHDPHSAKNAGQLRFPMDVADVEQNLCMRCHHKRGGPDPTSNRSPHSPEGPLLLGEGGWFPPSMADQVGQIRGAHGSDRNPKLCATCHVSGYQVTDAAGKFTFASTGHSFQAIPCVGANKLPDGRRDCTLQERSFRACVTCHLTETSARSALTASEARLERLGEEVIALALKAPASQFNTTDNKITTAEGAKFNGELALKTGSAVHNPFLVEALVLASIKQLEIDYGIKASGAVALTPQLKP